MQAGPSPYPMFLLDAEKHSIIQPPVAPAEQLGSALGDRTHHWALLAEMNFWMKEWQVQGGLSLKSLWKLPRAKFEEKQENLLDFMHWKASGCGRVDGDYPCTTARGREISAQIKVDGKEQWEYEAL